MVQIKQEHPESGGRPESDTASDQRAKDPIYDPEEYLKERVDQIGTIMAKGLDLVETSINLSINLMNRFTSAVGERIINRIGDVSASQGGMQEPPPDGSSMSGVPFQQDMTGPGVADSQPGSMYVVNRLPLLPGSPVKVSFSINNDSPSTPKRLRLRVEGFVGEMHGAELNGSDFSVKPASKVIAPLDFDKFTLIGAIPQNAPGDAYNGCVVVSEGLEELRIPVRLVVNAQ